MARTKGSKNGVHGMALAAKEGRGVIPVGGGMMGMSLEDLEHYAGTKEKGLPKRKGKKVAKKGKK